MADKMTSAGGVCALTMLLLVLGSTVQANWFETFNNNTFDLTTWEFHAVPNVTNTYNGIIQDGPDDNDYLALVETTSVGATPPGSIFGGAFGSNEQFTDVRVGAVVNVVGDASRNNYVLLGRAEYIVDDGSTRPYPGLWTTCYVLIMYWDEGPANLTFAVQKVIDNDASDVMRDHTGAFAAAMPGLDHARSYYAELDIVGSDPVYVTGSLYEYKDGPLVARAPTLVDTNGRDPWEEEREINYPVFTSGVSGVSAYNGEPEPPGYYCTFDDVFSVSDGPAAVNPNPADGAIDVPVNATLSWVEAAFATGREVWLGKSGAMEKIATPAGNTHIPGPLEFGQTYQWRVDQIGPSGTVTGRTWTFTTAECLDVEDFQSYGNDADIRAVWVDNITEAGLEYVFLASDAQGNKSMRFEFQNQYPPYFTEATRTFAAAQDWTQLGAEALSLFFIGEHENVEHPMYLRVEDAAGQSAKVMHPFTYACESDSWREWTTALADFSAGGVDLTNVKKLTIGLGSREGPSAQVVDVEERDHIYIDPIRLCPARCFNVDQVDLRGDLNGDCKVDIDDLVILMDNWLNNGLSATP